MRQQSQVSGRDTYEGSDWKGTRLEVEKLMGSLALPTGTSWGRSDRINEQADQDREMGINFLLALALVRGGGQHVTGRRGRLLCLTKPILRLRGRSATVPTR